MSEELLICKELDGFEKPLLIWQKYCEHCDLEMKNSSFGVKIDFDE